MLTIARQTSNRVTGVGHRRFDCELRTAFRRFTVSGTIEGLAGARLPFIQQHSQEKQVLIYDTIGIQQILPHRPPFLMVDTIVEMERFKRIVALKNVTINEAYFAGHFPGKPVMPGVLIIECMAQAGGLLLLQEIPEREKKLLYFVAIDEARFRRPVVPGDQLRIEIDVLRFRANSFCKLAGTALVGNEVAAEAKLMCKTVNREDA